MLSLILSALVSMAPAKEFKAKDYCPLVSVVTHASVAEAIQCLDKQKNKKLFVMSPGGDVAAGSVLVNYVNKKSVTVLCVRCYSMAAFLWLNADKKEFGEGGDMMVHYAWTMLPPDTPLTIPLLRELANDLELLTESFLTKCTAFQRDYFIKEMKKGDYYFGEDELNSLQIKYILINRPKQVE